MPTSVVCVVSDVFGHSIGAPLIILLTATPRWTVATSRKSLTALVFPFASTVSRAAAKETSGVGGHCGVGERLCRVKLATVGD